MTLEKYKEAYYKVIEQYRETKDSIIDHYLLSDLYDGLMFDLEGSYVETDIEDIEELKSEIARIRVNIKAVLKAKELIDSIELKFA